MTNTRDKRRRTAPGPRVRKTGGKAVNRPRLSVVVVLHNMPREAPRTLHSLSASYQRNIEAADYEVLVVDNGSNPPVAPADVKRFGPNFHLIRMDPALPSPARAINRGIAKARGEIIGVMIDGARLATPGLLHFALAGAHLERRAVVATLGWYLGFDHQRRSMLAGHDRSREDELLQSIAWPKDGYRLFEIGTLDESSTDAGLTPIAESNAIFMKRRMWEHVGGYDERFDSPGGGLVNLDTFARALAVSGARLVILLGEGTFHQFHGGIATNANREQMSERYAQWAAQYEGIRGRKFSKPELKAPPLYLGTLPRAAMKHLAWAAVRPRPGTSMSTLGPGFDLQLWGQAARPAADPIVARLVERAHKEFRAGRFDTAAAVARIARQQAPNEPEPLRLLSLIPDGEVGPAPTDWEHGVLGDAWRIAGKDDLARSSYLAALEKNPDLDAAHMGLSLLNLRGANYYAWIEWFHRVLRPAIYIEIGIYHGESLKLAAPPTLAIGVDPAPRMKFPVATETHIFPETSDAFFERRGPDALMAGRPLGLAFIDGLHLFEQSLKDFIYLERYCDPRSVILIHDTIPLDERTQRRARDTGFHTGDIWKLVLCLKHYRPDLEVFTIATPWTGLTVIAGFNSAGKDFAERYEEAVTRFIDLPFSEVEEGKDAALNVVPNDWNVVWSRLETIGVLKSSVGSPSHACQLSTKGLPVNDLGRALYLDLLVRTLTNTIYRDARVEGPSDAPFDPAAREVGADWPRTAHTMVGLKRLENLRDLVQRTLDAGISGDYIETGVWRGGSCILMRGVLAANGVTDRKVYVCDSFEGLPPPSPDKYPKDRGLDLSGYKHLAVSLEVVRDNFARYGLLDDRVVFVKGLFKDTLPGLDAGPFALIRLDGDLYESTMDALVALYPKLSPGGYAIIDDYAIEACKAAVADYREQMGITSPIQQIDWTGVWWQKA